MLPADRQQLLQRPGRRAAGPQRGEHRGVLGPGSGHALRPVVGGDRLRDRGPPAALVGPAAPVEPQLPGDPARGEPAHHLEPQRVGRHQHRLPPPLVHLAGPVAVADHQLLLGVGEPVGVEPVPLQRGARAVGQHRRQHLDEQQVGGGAVGQQAVQVDQVRDRAGRGDAVVERHRRPAECSGEEFLGPPAVEPQPGAGAAEHHHGRRPLGGREPLPELDQLVAVERVADAGVQLRGEAQPELHRGEEGEAPGQRPRRLAAVGRADRQRERGRVGPPAGGQPVADHGGRGGHRPLVFPPPSRGREGRAQNVK